MALLQVDQPRTRGRVKEILVAELARRRRAGGNGQTGQQTPKDAVTDDQIRDGLVRASHRVSGSCGKRQQSTTCTKTAINAGDAGRFGDDGFSSRTKQAMRALVTVRTRHKHMFADAVATVGTCFDDFASGFVSGDQRVAHAGERGHFACPEQLFSAGGNARMFDGNDNIIGARRNDSYLVKPEVSGRR